MKVQAVKSSDGTRAYFDIETAGDDGIRITPPNGVAYYVPRESLEDAIFPTAKRMLKEIIAKLDLILMDKIETPAAPAEAKYDAKG